MFTLLPIDGQSHVRGETSEPLWHKTIPQLLTERACALAQAPAAVFVEHGIRWSYRDLAEESDRLAAGLLAIGLQPGDRIGVWSPNRPEWVALQFASARIGLVLVTINPAYRIGELEHALNKVGVKALLLARRFKSSNYPAMLEELAPELKDAAPGELRASRVPSLRHCIVVGQDPVAGMYRYPDVVSLGRSIDAGEIDRISKSLNPDDPINVQFTSGTTGAPKGAALTHVNIVNNARFTASTIRLRSGDRLCIPVPLYHCFGMVMGSLACVATGATMVFPSESFDAEATLKAVSEEGCSGLYGVPTMFVSMLELLDEMKVDLSRLRTGIMAGAPCPMEIMRQVQDRLNMKGITIAYGMTETSPVSFQSHVDDPLERRVTTVGRIHPHVEVKIIDGDGTIVPVGRQGELCTRGYSVMHGYWGDPDASRESIDEFGWMHTGDLGVIDTEGYCSITGRIKDMVIRGGENIYPREIEEYLYRHAAIKGAQVFGVPDRKLGEELCAWIVLRDECDISEEDVRAFCRKGLAHYKVPRHVRFVEKFPMTISGKPQKFLMREAMISENDPL